MGRRRSDLVMRRKTVMTLHSILRIHRKRKEMMSMTRRKMKRRRRWMETMLQRCFRNKQRN